MENRKLHGFQSLPSLSGFSAQSVRTRPTIPVPCTSVSWQAILEPAVWHSASLAPFQLCPQSRSALSPSVVVDPCGSKFTHFGALTIGIATSGPAGVSPLSGSLPRGGSNSGRFCRSERGLLFSVASRVPGSLVDIPLNVRQTRTELVLSPRSFLAFQVLANKGPRLPRQSYPAPMLICPSENTMYRSVLGG